MVFLFSTKQGKTDTIFLTMENQDSIVYKGLNAIGYVSKNIEEITNNEVKS